MKKIWKILLGILLLMVVLIPVLFLVSGITPLSLRMHDQTQHMNGQALAGYDPVSYFEGDPVRGSTAFSISWKGAQWLFTSAAHRDAFRADPERYAPMYGGHCALAVSTGFAAPGEPTSWAIHGGRLYIFTDNEVKKEFMQEPEKNIAACELNWHTNS